MQAVEDGDVSLITRALRLDQDGAARFVKAGGNVQSVKMQTDGAVENTLGHEIHRVAVGIDDGRCDNAFLVVPLSGAAGQGAPADAGDGATIEHAGVPELDAAVGVNRENRIRLGNEVDDVMSALTGNVHTRHV